MLRSAERAVERAGLGKSRESDKLAWTGIRIDYFVRSLHCGTHNILL